MKFLNPVFAFFFDLFGWKIEGEIPADLKKAALPVSPHNIWLDFPVGLGLRAKIKRDIRFLGKAELFNGPFGWMFKAFGGTPVVRTKNSNVVDSYAKLIDDSDEMLFSLAPEGTRKNVQKLRTGFYYIALKAQIPILPVGFDYDRKTAVFSEPFMPTGNFEADMETYFVPFYKTISREKDWVKNYENGNFGD